MPEIDREARLVLASRSPRRREIVEAIDPPVELSVPDVEEGGPRPGETPADFVVRLSGEKALSVQGRMRGAGGEVARTVTLGADTVVVLDGNVLGKPSSFSEAIGMLEALRGRTHAVVTGVTAVESWSGRRLSVSKLSHVTMRRYSHDEATAYVESGEPFDKAGAYAVQDTDFRPAQSVEGCYLNVVGLPLCEVMGLMESAAPKARLLPAWRTPPDCRECPLDMRR